MPEIIGRLKRRTDYKRVAREGQKCAMRGLVLQAAPFVDDLEPTPDCDLRIGLTVTKRIGNAVVRNRARRRLRAAASEVFPTCARSGYDYVLIARQSTPVRPYRDLIGDMETALARLDRPLSKRSNG